jgi:FkbM family methyltransferase
METVAGAKPEGPRYHLSTRWFTEWTTWFYGTQDAEIHSWIVRHARPEWVAFDIGMNFGYFTCLLGRQCAAVHGFEPIPWLAKRARANVELNDFHNVSIAEVALSDSPGEASLNLPSEEDCNWGTSSLVHKSTGKAVLQVPLETVDSYVERQAINRLDFMKIDVEGAEHLVLTGALKTIKRHQPAIVFERNVESFCKVIEILNAFDYNYFDLHENPLGEDINHWPHDVLAVKKR